MTDGGTQKASWSTDSGVNQMSVVEAVTHLPEAKPQVVIAQIHDQNNDVVEIVADGTRSTSPGTWAICVRYNGRTQARCLDDSYRPGTRIALSLRASGGVITIGLDNSASMSFVNHTVGCYFKAGAYVQSNTKTGDVPSAYGEVILYALHASHEL